MRYLCIEQGEVKVKRDEAVAHRGVRALVYTAGDYVPRNGSPMTMIVHVSLVLNLFMAEYLLKLQT